MIVANRIIESQVIPAGSTWFNDKKNKVFKQGIGIAKKAKKQEGITGVVM